MKFSFGFILTIITLLIVISITLWHSCSNITPYSKNTLFSHQFPYEGFGGMKSHSYTTYPDNIVIDSKDTNSIVDATLQQNCKKVFGFKGLLCSPDTPDNSLDIYSTAHGSINCKGGSSGLTNSHGPLCLDANQIKMLQTRGGNMLGGETAIGK